MGKGKDVIYSLARTNCPFKNVERAVTALSDVLDVLIAEVKRDRPAARKILKADLLLRVLLHVHHRPFPLFR